MKNKTIKNMFNEKINKKEIYNNILSIKKEKRLNLIPKVAITVSIILIAIIFMSYQHSENMTSDIRIYNSKEVLEKININKITDKCETCITSQKINLYTEEIGIKQNNSYSNNKDNLNMINKIKIPPDIVLISNEKIDNLYDSIEKIILYEVIYKDDSKQKKVKIIYSDNNAIIESYKISELTKISKIKNTDLYIYNLENSYRAVFKYKNTYFRIESEEITKEEFIAILKSVIEE